MTRTAHVVAGDLQGRSCSAGTALLSAAFNPGAGGRLLPRLLPLMAINRATKHSEALGRTPRYFAGTHAGCSHLFCSAEAVGFDPGQTCPCVHGCPGPSAISAVPWQRLGKSE